MPDDLSQRVISVVAATQHIAPEKVTLDSTFEELGIDSLDGINILFAVENEFNISIPDDAAKAIRSVREMVEGVDKLVSAGSGAKGALAS
ncbi:MAG TPA: phosphopantetheine-binding protein [Bryobacteraceae bacterium]|nr:phosphopantetheine-binding protein [Bryobacteraceae bacterium]